MRVICRVISSPIVSSGTRRIVCARSWNSQTYGFQRILNSCFMQCLYNVELSIRAREEYTGFYKPEIEEILDGSPALASHRSAHYFRFWSSFIEIGELNEE